MSMHDIEMPDAWTASGIPHFWVAVQKLKLDCHNMDIIYGLW